MLVKSLATSALSDRQIKDINDLTDATWPETIPENNECTARKDAFLARNPGKQCHLIYDSDVLAAYAESFERKIQSNKGVMSVMGIGAVCVSQNYRGKGFGADIVKKCFERVPVEFAVCLFQTGVPEFYQKLGCRLIDNQFIDSTNLTTPNKNPFWDEFTMIYPKSFNWPKGTIDLLGRGY